MVYLFPEPESGCPDEAGGKDHAPAVAESAGSPKGLVCRKRLGVERGKPGDGDAGTALHAEKIVSGQEGGCRRWITGK